MFSPLNRALNLVIKPFGCVAIVTTCLRPSSQTIDNRLRGAAFDKDKVAEWTAKISEECLQGCRGLEKPFKFVGGWIGCAVWVPFSPSVYPHRAMAYMFCHTVQRTVRSYNELAPVCTHLRRVCGTQRQTVSWWRLLRRFCSVSAGFSPAFTPVLRTLKLLSSSGYGVVEFLARMSAGGSLPVFWPLCLRHLLCRAGLGSGSCTVRWENESLYCIVIIYGLGI